MSDVTRILDRVQQGDSKAAEELLPLVYPESRFFGGLPNVEAALVLGLAERTATRTWAYARAWLYDELKRTL